MLQNFDHDIKLFAEYDSDFVGYAQWVDDEYRRRRANRKTNNNLYDGHDRDGFMGEYTLYNYLRSCSETGSEERETFIKRFIWDGYQEKPYGDDYDYLVMPPFPEYLKKNYVKIDNKNRKTNQLAKNRIAEDLEVYVTQGSKGATQIEKPIDIYTFTGIYDNESCWNGKTYHQFRPLIFGWEWKQDILSFWRHVEPGETIFRDSIADKHYWFCKVRDLQGIDGLQNVLGL